MFQQQIKLFEMSIGQADRDDVCSNFPQRVEHQPWCCFLTVLHFIDAVQVRRAKPNKFSVQFTRGLCGKAWRHRDRTMYLAKHMTQVGRGRIETKPRIFEPRLAARKRNHQRHHPDECADNKRP